MYLYSDKKMFPLQFSPSSLISNSLFAFLITGKHWEGVLRKLFSIIASN